MMVQVVCRKCWQHKWALSFTDGKKVNVCDECHQTMLGVQGDACAHHLGAINDAPDEQQEASDADSDSSDGTYAKLTNPAATRSQSMGAVGKITAADVGRDTI